MARNGISVRVAPELGKAEAGIFWVPLSEQGLTEEQLALDRVRNCLCLQGESVDRPLDVTEPTWEGVLQALEYLGNRQQAERERARIAEQKRAESIAALNEKARRLIAGIDEAIANSKPSDFLLVEVMSHGYRVWSAAPYISDCYGSDYRESVIEAISRLKQEAARRTEAEKAELQACADALSDEAFFAEFGPTEAKQIDRFDRLQRILAEYEQEREAEERAEIRRYLEDAPSNVLERFEADVLPEPELKQILADKLFGDIDCPRYEKLIADDLPEHDDECGEPRVKYQSESYDGVMTAEQWSNYKALGEATKPLGLTPELRIHSVYCENCTARTSRLSGRVTKRIGSISVARLYRI